MTWQNREFRIQNPEGKRHLTRIARIDTNRKLVGTAAQPYHQGINSRFVVPVFVDGRSAVSWSFDGIHEPVGLSILYAVTFFASGRPCGSEKGKISRTFA
jgi:hypothetical protein